MDIVKIKGILDAVEAESKQPSPSHNNLARLTHMALVEIMNFLDMLCKGIVPLMMANAVPAEAPPAPAAEPVKKEETSENQPETTPPPAVEAPPAPENTVGLE